VVTPVDRDDVGLLRPAPAGLPETAIQPPVVAESGDPFTALRIIGLVAQLARGRPIRVSAIVDRLNATNLDWLFEARVVLDALLQLQANWMTDYRNAAGIVLDEGTRGTTLTIEDSSRVDPWIVRQARREADSCHETLLAFSRRDRPSGE
jgi:hypothetical protein